MLAGSRRRDHTQVPLPHSHIGRDSKYVTPIPDHRLNLTRVFTLARPLGDNDIEIFVEQNPVHSTMAEGRKVLKLGPS